MINSFNTQIGIYTLDLNDVYHWIVFCWEFLTSAHIYVPIESIKNMQFNFYQRKNENKNKVLLEFRSNLNELPEHNEYFAIVVPNGVNCSVFKIWFFIIFAWWNSNTVKSAKVLKIKWDKSNWSNRFLLWCLVNE